ncbi:MAG: hypothetical protein ABI875_04405, partial [Gemmatimonadales bacterium]
MISRQPFFELLAATKEDSAAWHPVVEGLAVLRMIDSRVEHDQHRDFDGESTDSIRNAVSAISEGDPVRAILLQLIEAVGGTEIQRDALARGLLGFGRALDFDGRWALACDVYATADKVAGPRNGARRRPPTMPRPPGQHMRRCRSVWSRWTSARRSRPLDLGLYAYDGYLVTLARSR